jgi:predicted acyltransferase (DUF342 family)
MRLVTLAIVVAAVLFGVEAAAVQEQQLPYSGVALTPSGAPVADGLHQMEFRLYTGATASEPVWTELQLVQTRSGSYQVVLGQSRPLPLTTGQQYWLEVLCDGASLGRMPLALLPSQAETKVAARSLQELHLNPVQSAAPDGWVRAGLPTLGGATPPQPLVVNTCEECTTTFWALTGNAGTNPNNNFLGTTDNQPLIIRTNNVNRVRITTGGQIEVLYSARSVSLGEGAGLRQDLTAFRNNVFVGYQAGSATETGIQNVAVGSGALSQNIGGSSNTALGSNAMSTLTTGDYNTAIGYGAEVGDGLTNATAIGAFAFAGQSNTVVIGSIQGVNGATATANVGIGTTTPMNRLHVVSTADPLRLEGLLVNSALDNVLVVDASGVVKKRSLSGFVGSTAWLLTGNTLSGGEVLGSLNPQPLVLVTSNVERMRITATGDVGIGTSTPAARLDVVNPTGGGVLRLQAVVGQTGALLEWVDDLGNTLGVIDGGGLVGIGTAAPVQKLHVVGNGAVSAVFVEGGVGVGTVNPLATLHVYDEGTLTPGATQVIIQAGANQTGVNLLEWWDNAGTVLGGIDDAGNLFVKTNTTLGDAAGDVVTVNAGTVALPNIPSGSTATEVLVWNAGNVERRSAEGLAWLLTGNSGTNPAVNFLGTTDAQPLVIRTDNVERVRITATGDVGIGTAAPAATLDVVGTAQVSGNTSIGGSLTVAGDATVSGTTVALPNIPSGSTATEVLVWNAGNVEYRSASGLISGLAWMLGGNTLTSEQTLGTLSAHDLPIITAGTERVRITQAGDVGIGTSTPGARLDVVNPTGGGVLRLQAVVGQTGALLEWVNELGNTLGVIDNSGLVGIGTATPVQKLHVEGNGTASAVFVEGGVGVGTVNPLATLHVYDEGTLTPGATQVIIQAGANQTGVNLLQWWDNTGTVVLGGIDDAGNLFVKTNTTLGDAAGDVVTVNAGTVALPNIPSGSTATEVLVWNAGNVERRSASGLISGFAWMLGGNTLTSEQTLGTLSAHDLPIITAGTERVRITQAGDVGIGTGTPGARLHVVGTGRFDGQLTVTTGGAAITGNSTVTGTLTVSSDVSVGGNLTVDGNTTLGDAAGDVVTVNAGTVALPNIPALSTATEVLVWNGGNVEHRSASGLISGFAWMLGGNTLTSEQTLGTLSAHDLPIITAGTEKVRITQAGDVGIGTSTPGARLHVVGTGRFDGQLTVTAGGAAITGNSTVTGTLTVSSDVSVGGNLTVAGNTTLGDAAGDVVTVNAGTVALPNIPALSTATEVLVWNAGNVERRSASGLISGFAWMLGGNTLTSEQTLGTLSAHDLPIITAGTERVRITQAGHVLPGADNAYDLGSATRRWRSGYFGTSVVVGTSVSLVAGTPDRLEYSGDGIVRTSGYLAVETGGAERLRVTAAGDVVVQNQAAGTPTTVLRVLGGGGGAGATQVVLQAGTGQSGVNLLEWRDGTGQLIGVIDDAGFMGIGVNNAGFGGIAAYLHVYSNTAQPAAVFENGIVRIGNIGGSGVSAGPDLQVWDEPGATQVILQLGTAQTGVNLLEWQNAVGTVLGRIDDAGNLFVNTNTTLGDAAGDVVTVNAGTVALPNIPALSTATEVLVWNGGNVEHRSASGLISGFAWMLGGNTLTSEQTLGTLSAHDLPIITAGTEKVRITQAGDVGIGTSTPGARLHVVGTGRFDGQLTVTAGGAAITGNSTVTGTLTVSSNVSVGGNLTVAGNTTLGNNAAVDLVTFNARVQSDVVPSADNAYDLGAAGQRWKDGWFGGNVNVGGNLAVSGTTVALPNIPGGSTATEVLVWNGGNVEHRSASGLISGFAWMLGGNTLTSEQTLGTLSAHDLPIITAGTEKVRITQAGHVLPGADNAYDLGSATRRWRSGYFGTSVVVGTSVSLVAGTPDRLEYSGDGIVRTSGYLAVETGGAERLRVTAAGDVVVQNQAAGTPTTVLRVLGGGGGAGATQVVLQAGTGQSGVNLLEWRDGTGQLIGVIDDAGFMGIGVNNAGFGGIAAYLHVYSNTAQPAAVFENGIVRIGNIGGSGVSAGPDLQVWDEPGATQVILQLGTAQTGVNLLEWQNAVGTVLGRIDDAGNLFVNTNTTLGDAAGDVVTVNAGTVALPNIPALSTATEVLVWNGGNVEHRSASGLISGFAWMLGGNTLTSEQTLGTLSAHDLPIITAGTEKVRITQAGDVGIGTSTPGARLHVVGTGRFDGQLTVTAGGAAITGNSTVTGTLTVSSNVSVGGNLTVAGNTTLGNNAAVDLVTFNARVQSDVVPSADNAYDLGAAGQRWKDGWFGGNVNVGGNLAVSGTTVALPNIPGGSTATEVLVWNGGNVEHRSASGLISGFAWMLGGNTLTSEQTLGTLSAHDLPIITAGTEKVRITQAGHVLPGTDNAYDLGSATRRWRSGYFGTSVVVGTSVSLVAGTPDRLEYSGDGIVRTSGYLAVETGGAERLRVTAAGDVVVQNQAAGTPTTVLRVLGGNSGAGATQVVLQAGTGQSGVNLLEWRDGTGQLIGVIDDAGFMGIGVNNAGFGGIAAYLHVYSNLAQPAAIFENGAVGIGTNAPAFGSTLHIYDARTAPGTGATKVIIQAGANQAGVNLLEWQDDTGLPVGFIDNAGNVAIGDVNDPGFTGAGAYLHIFSNTAQPAAIFQRGVVGIGTGAPAIGGPVLHVVGENPGVAAARFEANVGSTPLELQGVPTAVAADEVLRIDPATGEVKKSTVAAVISAGIIKGSFPIAASGSSFTIFVAPADIQPGAIVTVTLVGPSGGTIYPLMVTNVNAVAETITVESSATIPGGVGYAIHYIIINP